MRSLIVCLALAVTIAPATAQNLHTGFDTGLEGWTTSVGGSLTHSVTGGNPGGFLQQQDLDLTDMFVSAPALFLGNQITFLGGSISFDVKQLVGTADYQPFGIVQLRSGVNVVFADIVPSGFPTSDWTTQAVNLNAAAFGTTEANFASILSNLTALEITLESQFGVFETVGFDNFRMSIASVPEPATLALLSLVSGAALVYSIRRRMRCWLVKRHRRLSRVTA